MPRARTQSGSAIWAATVSELATVIHAMPPANMAGAAIHAANDDPMASLIARRAQRILDDAGVKVTVD